MANKFDENLLDTAKRTVALIGDVDSELSTRCFIAFQRFTGTDPITVFLDTDGGDVDEGLFIYDTIRDSKAHVTIKILSKAWSIGSIIAQAADTRFMHPEATVMWHSGSGDIGGNTSEIPARFAFDRRQEARCDNILLDRLKAADPRYSRAKLERSNAKGIYYTAEQCLTLGLIDEIKRG